MPDPEELAAQVPCIVCQRTPTSAFVYGTVRAQIGRVCRTHANTFANQGLVVVGRNPRTRRPMVKNWPHKRLPQ